MKAKDEEMKYCEKHNQQYMAFLPICPICRGETMGRTLHKIIVSKEKEGV